MDFKKNKIFIYFFILILFVAGFFYLKRYPLFQKYIGKLDFINYKKTVDYLGKKHSQTFSQHHHHNVYGSVNFFKFMNKDLNQKEISFITNNYQNYLSLVQDQNIKSILSLKFLNMKYQLKNSEYSLQILNYINQYPWNNISKAYKNNIKNNIYKNSELNFLYLNNNISFN